MHRPTATSAVVLATALVLAACGGTPAGTAETGTATPEPTAMPSMDHPTGPPETTEPTEAATPTDAGAGAVEVQVGMSSFAPGTLTIDAGTEVTFLNGSGLPHTVTHGSGGRAVDDPAFDRPIDDGATIRITFDEPGTYEVTCKIHPTMQMTITVEG